MCNARPGSRCKDNGQKALATSIKKAKENVIHANKLADAIRISKNNDDIEFNAERYENVAKALETSMRTINTRKIYLYAASPKDDDTKEVMRNSTADFDTVERAHLRPESELMATGKLLKKFQDGADKAHNENSKSENPAGQKVLAQALDEKTFPKLYKDIKSRIDTNYATRISAAADSKEKKSLKTEHQLHIKLLNDAHTLASDDAKKVYETKSSND